MIDKYVVASVRMVYGEDRFTFRKRGSECSRLKDFEQKCSIPATSFKILCHLIGSNALCLLYKVRR